MDKTATQEQASAVTASFDAATAFMRRKRDNGPERVLQLGYVHLGDDHPRPHAGKSYPIVSASSEAVGAVPVPASPFRRMHLDLYEFFIDDMPDTFVARNNEGMLKVEVSTKNPQNLNGSTFDATFVTEFQGADGSYAPSFLYRGVFRNILLQDWVNVKFELYELDTDVSDYYEKITGVIDKVPELKSIDILDGIPYLNLASQLFDGIIKTFGRNPDDHLWGELPIMEVQPTPGGAFLRTGIYVLAEKWNSNNETISFEEVAYRNGSVMHRNGIQLSNHLVFGVSVVEHAPT